MDINLVSRIKRFLSTSILGGLTVILPISILIFALEWIFSLVRRAVSPLAVAIEERTFVTGWLADIMAILVVLTICFFLGVLVKTKVGGFLHHFVEHRILTIIPGYSAIREIVLQLIGKTDKKPFSQVAVVRPFDNATRMTGFVTDFCKERGFYTVFVPTGPNPTTGFIFHLPEELVEIVGIPPEKAMRSIIGCGVGSADIINQAQAAGFLAHQSS